MKVLTKEENEDNKRLSLRLPVDMHERLRMLAYRKNKSLNLLVHDMISDQLAFIESQERLNKA